VRTFRVVPQEVVDELLVEGVEVVPEKGTVLLQKYGLQIWTYDVHIFVEGGTWRVFRLVATCLDKKFSAGAIVAPAAGATPISDGR
jgi:hypothetical protein